MPKTAKKAKKHSSKKKKVSKVKSKPVAHKPNTIIVEKKILVQPKFGKLKYVPTADEYFVLMSGKAIRSLRELAQDLGEMDDVVFYHHVNDYRNDFVSWVKDIFNELELAEKISNERDKKRMQIIIYEHIVDKLW